LLYSSTPLELVEIKAGSDGTMTFSAYASTFGNTDRGGDVIEKGAFRDTLRESNYRPLLWQHDMSKPIGIEKSIREDSKGLLGTWELVDTAQGQEAYKLLKAGAVRSMSIGYIPTKWEYRQEGDSAIDATRVLKSVELLENSVVTIPMNPQATVQNVKHFCHECMAAIDELDTALKATWTAAYVNSLPDSSFALVYTDGDGNKQRKLPHHDKGGSLDLPHLRNALSRAPQMTGVSDAQRSRAVAHLERHANAEGIGNSGKTHDHVYEDDAAEDVPAASYEDMTLAELAGVVAEVAEAFGVRTRELISKLNAGEFSLNESKRLDFQTFLETFSGLDVVRHDVEAALAQKTTTEIPNTSGALRLAIELRRAKMRRRGLEI
jgi:uncharacterized protein